MPLSNSMAHAKPKFSPSAGKEAEAPSSSSVPTPASAIGPNEEEIETLPPVWTDDEELFLHAVMQSSEALSKLYLKEHMRLTKVQTKLKIPAIIIGSFTGVASFGSKTFPEEYQGWVSIGVGLTSVSIAILNTIESYFKISERSNTALTATNALQQLREDINIELSIPVEDRQTSGIIFLRDAFTRYKQIISQAPTLSEGVYYINELIKQKMEELRNKRFMKMGSPLPKSAFVQTSPVSSRVPSPVINLSSASASALAPVPVSAPVPESVPIITSSPLKRSPSSVGTGGRIIRRRSSRLFSSEKTPAPEPVSDTSVAIPPVLNSIQESPREEKPEEDADERETVLSVDSAVDIDIQPNILIINHDDQPNSGSENETTEPVQEKEEYVPAQRIPFRSLLSRGGSNRFSPVDFLP